VAASLAQLDAERVLLDSERLTERAYVDELTGLANRHSYQRHLGRIRGDRADGEVAVIMVDVDHFKVVNDFFGHAVGDEVLRRLGAILRGVTRQDDLAVRLGGDEFLVLCHIAADRDILTQATDLVARIASHDWHELADQLKVSVSAGLATGAPADVDELVRQADGHLYRAKSTGRARLMHGGR
jgi:diguanylate cyclase (GGDEF)-like protein